LIAQPFNSTISIICTSQRRATIIHSFIWSIIHTKQKAGAPVM